MSASRPDSISVFNRFSASVNACCADATVCWKLATWVCASTTSIGARVPSRACRSLLDTWPCACASACVCTARLRSANARSQYACSTSVSWSITIWVSCASVRSTALRASRICRRSASMRPAAAERLDVARPERRGKLRVQAREHVAGLGSRRGEVGRVAAARPWRAARELQRPAEQALLDASVDAAANRRRARRRDPLIRQRGHEVRIEDALRRAHVLPRRIDFEPRDGHVVVLLQRQPDGVREREGAGCGHHADARRQHHRGRRFRRLLPGVCRFSGLPGARRFSRLPGARRCSGLRAGRTSEQEDEDEGARQPRTTHRSAPCFAVCQRPVTRRTVRRTPPVARSHRRPIRSHAGDSMASSNSE